MDSLPSGVPLSEIPAGKPPAGVEPNFVDPKSLANAIVTVNAVFLALMLVFITIRIYTKALLLNSLWWDDYTALIAAAGSIAHSGVAIHHTDRGLGRHMWDVPLSYLTTNDIHTLQADTVISYPTYLFMKVSILLLYYRLFSVNKRIRYLIWAGILLQIIGYTAFTGCAIGLEVICSTAVAAQTNAFCLNNYKVTYTQSLFSFLTDVYVLLLPISVVAGLQLSFRRKIGVIMIFMTGILACVASLVRAIVSIQKLHTTDVLYEAGYISIFSAVEINTSIIAAAATILPVFLSKSGAVSFGKSAMTSLRSRLFGRSKSSLSGPKTGSSNPKYKAHDGDGSYVELNETKNGHTTPWEKDGKAGAGASGILRRDDYEVASLPKAYAPV